MLKGDNIVGFLQEWDAGLLACGDFKPDARWIHSHFRQELKKSSKLKVEFEHYQRAEYLPDNKDFSYEFLYSAAWRQVQREMQERNRQAQLQGNGRANQLTGGGNDGFEQSQADKRREANQKRAAAKKEKKEAAQRALGAREQGGSGGPKPKKHRDGRPRGQDSAASGSDSNKCKCCGKAGHEKKDCKFKDYECNVCGKKGHLRTVCNSGGSPKPGKGTGQGTGKGGGKGDAKGGKGGKGGENRTPYPG